MADDIRTDIAEAKSRMHVRMKGGREIKRLVEHLWQGETVDRMTVAKHGLGKGVIVLTNRRVFFIQQGMLAHKIEDFPIDRVTSVELSSGWATGSLSVSVPGNKAVFVNVNKHDGKDMADLIRSRIGSAPDVMAQLRELGELRDAGVVTPEEFEAKKAELLKRL